MMSDFWSTVSGWAGSQKDLAIEKTVWPRSVGCASARVNYRDIGDTLAIERR